MEIDLTSIHVRSKRLQGDAIAISCHGWVVESTIWVHLTWARANQGVFPCGDIIWTLLLFDYDSYSIECFNESKAMICLWFVQCLGLGVGLFLLIRKHMNMFIWVFGVCVFMLKHQLELFCEEVLVDFPVNVSFPFVRSVYSLLSHLFSFLFLPEFVVVSPFYSAPVVI